ncbi:MAG: hypothetical protein CYG60_19565 [Actinobacteria bacterium]|jgi:hypothetical protein|nr:hypothetical protein [Actinomycetota bacterium]PLS84126.1 MAG: hypothetical protein CYG60_19565 [Actinomycetota bacterium]
MHSAHRATPPTFSESGDGTNDERPTMDARGVLSWAQVKKGTSGDGLEQRGGPTTAQDIAGPGA